MFPVQNFIVLLCVLVMLSCKASSLSCNHCYSVTSWDICDRNVSIGECNGLIATDRHRALVGLNPNLQLVPPNFMNFQCYQVELRLKHQAGPTTRMYERGCTYSQANFCYGWDLNVIQDLNCSLSSVGVPDVDDGAVDDGSGYLSGSQRALITCWTVALGFGIVFIMM